MCKGGLGFRVWGLGFRVWGLGCRTAFAASGVMCDVCVERESVCVGGGGHERSDVVGYQ